MNLILTILIGLALGVMVELLLPRHVPSELVLLVLLGIDGSLIARYVGEKVGWFGTDEAESFVASVIGATVFLLLYVLARRRSASREKRRRT